MFTRSFRRSFWKTLLVDSAVMLFLFGVFLYTKRTLAAFFILVESYEVELQALESGLENQSTAALLEFEKIIGGFDSLVSTTLILLLIILPVVLYLVLVLSQSLNVGLLQKKTSFKYLGKAVLVGLPFLVIFFLILESVVESIGDLFTSSDTVVLAVVYGFVLLLMAYSWFVAIVLLSLQKLRSGFAVLYKRMHVLFPLFLLYVLLYVLGLALIGWLVIRQYTNSFYGYSWVSTVLAVLGLLAVAQGLRSVLVQVVRKSS
jgi:hypothetical protein